MNIMEKLGVAIAGIAIVAGIIIYATSGTSAFSPQPIDRAYPNIAIYIADSGDDANSGRIITEPVRSIRRAAEITNSLTNANVSVLFIEDEYEVVYTDMIKPGNYNQQDIIFNNPNRVIVRPIDSVEYVSFNIVYNPERYGTLPILCTGKTDFTMERLSFIETALPVQIHAEEKATLNIRNNKFGKKDNRLANPNALDVFGGKIILIENNEIYVPSANYSAWVQIHSGIRINQMTTRESEVTIINNRFIFSANYESSYSGPYYNFSKDMGITAWAGQIKIVDNKFETKNYIGQPSVYPPLYSNMHNVGILTGHGVKTVDIVNNNFINFDGANVVSQSHVENSYTNSNKQNVILRDNYMGRI